MVARKPLTLAQALVLQYVFRFIAEYGYPPTLREMMVFFRWHSTNAAHEHVVSLQRKGWLARDGKVARGIRVLASADELIDELARIEEAA